MPDIGVPELLIIAVIVVLLFGPGKAADLGGALGKSIREFRRASTEDDAPKDQSTVRTSLEGPSADVSAPAADTHNGVATTGTRRFCTECGTAISDTQKFCTTCGTPTAVAS
jgi:sec-independent protein translocase protein TatA